MGRTTELYGTRTLTNRESKIIKLVAEGNSNQEVADTLGNSIHVVKNYLRVIYDKTGTWSRAELAVWYLNNQIQ
jgi:DNA-binding CsgD family transcriptional regulator